jgi:membrane peptidoglycan carboxypeptidase
MSSTRPTTRAQAKAAQSRRAAAARRGGRGGGRPAGGAGRRWAKRLGLTALIGLALGVITFGIAYAVIDTPQPNDLVDAQASIVYYADGKTEMDRISVDGGNRVSVPLAKVPKAVQEAHLAAEDRNFYENSGISPTGIARAVWVGLRGGATQGGSTITQQYVKNYFLTQDQTISRKGREIIIAIKIAKQQSKDQILQNYLNTIYYGRGAYGIQTASKAYFGKDVSRLTVSEGALLASVIRGPSFYDPGLGKEQAANAKSRWTYVMDGMVSQGWITQAERDKAVFPTASLVKYTRDRGVGGTTGYIVKQVRDELRTKLKLSDSDIDKGGYRIVTTIDKKAQDAAVRAVKERMPQGKAAKDLHVGLTSIKPGDGAVVAMYGGADYRKEQFNTSTDARMQAGSTFKVFTLLAALSKDNPISTRTRFDGRSPQFFKEFEDPGAATEEARRGRVTNFGFESFGRIDVREATAHSVNTVYAQLNIEAGPKNTKDAAVAAGLPDKGLKANYANVLGTDTVRVVDMANAYATLAAGGVRVQPYLIRSVKGGPGGLDYKAKVVKKTAFDKDVVADTVDAMTQVVERGSGAYAQRIGRPLAGKTGTSTSNKSAWFDGFAPQLATAVGIYKGDGTKSMSNIDGLEVTGGSIPVQIWTEFMEAALRGQKVIDFPPRAGVGDDDVVVPTTTPSSTSSSSTSTTTTTTPPTTTRTTVVPPTRTRTTATPPPSTTITILPGGPTTTSQP